MKNNEFVIMVITTLVIWRVPLFFLDLGVIQSAILPVIGFLVGYWIVKLMRKRNKND